MNRLEFELIVIDFIEARSPKSAKELETISEMLHVYVENAVFDYAVDDENIDESEYGAQY